MLTQSLHTVLSPECSVLGVEVKVHSRGLDSKSIHSWPWCSSCTQRRRLVFGPRITLVDLHSRLMPTVAVAAVLEHGTSYLRRPILDLK